MSALAPARRPSRTRAALIAAAPVVAALVLGNLATIPNLPWYATLAKPPFNPPDWLFGPAWTVLYILMAIAFYRVLAMPAQTPGRRGAITAFAVQIVLNAGWSFAFFAAHSPLAGLVVIGALLVAIAVTIARFRAIDRVAGLCLVPYLAWVAFATLLDASIVWLNF